MGGKQSKNTSNPTPPKRGGTITPIDRATLDLKISRDNMSKYRKKLAIDSDKLATRAISLKAEGKIKNAVQLLRLRKYKLQEADRVEEQLHTVELMVHKIAEKQNELEVVQAMKQGKNALQILHEQMGIDEILELMDDIRDQNEVERRINEVIGQGELTFGDEDVLAELEQLEESVRLDEEKRNKERQETLQLPLAPKTSLPVVEQPKPIPAKVAIAS
ncbi:hypothetical protein ACHAXA_008663 [Cyclostephanos tholiformis]|uniref:Charged multivesicular body protein 6 n=1 Tax=Cyclostephanos tholiformis TaxID=382380 RepID=A0ABD3R3P8_9STRA